MHLLLAIVAQGKTITQDYLLAQELEEHQQTCFLWSENNDSTLFNESKKSDTEQPHLLQTALDQPREIHTESSSFN